MIPSLQAGLENVSLETVPSQCSNEGLVRAWIIEETGLETIGHVQCIEHTDWLRVYFKMVEPSGNL